MSTIDHPITSCVFRCRLGACLLAMILGACASAISFAGEGGGPDDGRYCEFTPAPDTGSRAPGLVVGAEILLPEGSRPGYGVHIRFNGSIGAIGEFDGVRADFPNAAVLDCRGSAVLSPGFVNAHEHPAYSWAFPDANLNPGYTHRDEWRLGTDGRVPLPIPQRIDFDSEDPCYLPH